ncbi:MAG: tRNA preQ1(34) S-adenosylmethionine ribosyltransferase-isomerase QueA [Deltaproteobacteria bacterium]|nr:tRNA preQ1(34) S-adenosylmethionine ribosyltransferase-isomerase QueA [Deltaproteobacteria bacterium]
MKLSEFDYSFPKELIAQHPLAERDASRMLVVNRSANTWQHRHVSELPAFLNAGDVLVINVTKVEPMRLFGEFRKGQALEVLLMEPLREQASPEVWRCLAKKAKRIDVGEKIFFGLSAQAVVTGHEEGYLLLAFDAGHRERAMERRGAPPLPPYIKRTDLVSYSEEDRKRYQTVFAEQPGSAAAPTAGLHLTEKTLEELKAKGIEIVPVTLHVGLDTFQPLRVDTIEEHRMHGERIEISPAAADALNRAKLEGRRIIACGTTSVRALESSWDQEKIVAGEKTTHLFITPGYEFHVIDGMLTNFHLPKSTLLMLVSAFVGKDFLFECYQEAIKEQYRLFSYGDCMLIV